MVTTESLTRTKHRINDLKLVRKELWERWHVLNDTEKRTKEEGKEQQSISTKISSLNYEIRGLEIKFKEMSSDYINLLVGL